MDVTFIHVASGERIMKRSQSSTFIHQEESGFRLTNPLADIKTLLLWKTRMTKEISLMSRLFLIGRSYVDRTAKMIWIWIELISFADILGDNVQKMLLNVSEMSSELGKQQPLLKQTFFKN